MSSASITGLMPEGRVAASSSPAPPGSAAHGGDGGGARGFRAASTTWELSGMPEVSLADVITNVSRITELRQSINKHNDRIAKLLLSSKETSERRTIVEAAFRACRDAFNEVTTVLIGVLNDKSEAKSLDLDGVKRVVLDALNEDKSRLPALPMAGPAGGGADGEAAATYAGVAGSSRPRVRVAGGLVVDVPASTSFYIVPSAESAHKFSSSQVTKTVLDRVFRPSDCGLKVQRISYAQRNGLRVDAAAPDMERIKSNSGIIGAGLEVMESIKFNPRLAVHGVPAGMSSSDIRAELIAQNLDGDDNAEIKVIYFFPLKSGKRHTSCIIEVPPRIRDKLNKNGRIYLRYSACRFGDHVRVLQCFRCTGFGHLVKDCKALAVCGHCSESHETRDCKDRSQPPKCGNCARVQGGGTASVGHSALDASRCPILGKRIKDRVSLINYG